MFQVIIDAQEAQLKNPARAVVNSESTFVKDRIVKAGFPDLAKEYWNWVCMSNRDKPVFGERVLELQKQLKAIDDQSTMPSWGTYGT